MCEEERYALPSYLLALMDRFSCAGEEIYLVGGSLRDLMRKQTPNDYDLATSASPEKTISLFPDCRVIETGIRHGTVTVLFEGNPIEITTFRQDGDYVDARHPQSVTFTRKIREDLARRDFTVNAMAYHPVRGLVDLYGGRTDLERRTISCVGDPATRFGEDGLRILRAIRFASVLDFEIAPETARAIHECRALLGNIAAERIREEFCKLI
jgi:tRNA nucleotidyltransferase (CCA-adding enzyme)